MVKKKNLFARRHLASSIFMLLALLWLTISIPFVYAGQQAQKQMAEKQQSKDTGYDANSLTNEERSESGVTTLSEYLHEMHVMEQHFCFIKSFYKAHPDQYFPTFAPELLSPPPEA